MTIQDKINKRYKNKSRSASMYTKKREKAFMPLKGRKRAVRIIRDTK
jgi:hypothetical protein